MFLRNLVESPGGEVTPGTGTSGFTAGAVIFADSTGALNEDATQLFYDDTNNRLGVGTASPDARIHAAMPAVASNTEQIALHVGAWTQTITSTVALARATVFQAPTFTSVGPVTVTEAATVYIDNAPQAGGITTFTRRYAFFVDAGDCRFDGNVGFGGQTNPTQAVHVTGSVAISGQFISNFNNQSCLVLNGGSAAGIVIGAGTVSAPTLTTTGDTNTGGYWPAAEQYAITCAGVQRQVWTDTSITSTVAGSTNTAGHVYSTTASWTATSGTVNAWNYTTSTWAPASGTAVYNHMMLSPTLSTSGSASGAVTVLNINPTISALPASTEHYLLRVRADSTSRFDVTRFGSTTITQQQVTIAALNSTALTVTGAAHINRTASTEYNEIYFNLAQTKTWLTGALATYRAIRFAAPTVNFSASSTLTTSVTLEIDRAPNAAANAIFTNSYVVQAGSATSLGATTASMQYAVFNVPAHTVTVTGTTGVTGIGFAGVKIEQITITDSSAVTFTNSASLYIANAPVAAGSVTLTNPYAIWVDAGISRFDGNGTHVFELPTAAAVAVVATRTVAFKDGGTTYYLMASTAA